MPTKIEWVRNSAGELGETWNPIAGCTKVSPGCKHCYAEKMAKRLIAMGKEKYVGTVDDKGRWTGTINFDEAALVAPLRWKRPRMVFVNSMSDLFHEAVSFEFIDRVFAVMALCPQHTFQVLTKRPARMAEYLNSPFRVGDELHDAIRNQNIELMDESEFFNADHDVPSWPLPNVWLGASVENQEQADKRIPALLKCPAAVRFLSCEPLLGPVDLAGWGDHAPSSTWDDAPATWSEFDWPDWIPVELRSSIQRFWSESFGRGPKAWMRDHWQQRVPKTGSRVCVALDKYGHGKTNKMVATGTTGRYVHCWNNIGRIVLDDGKVIFSSGGHGSGWLARWIVNGEYSHMIDWVICGGESGVGPGIRPMHPDWARSLRDQCQAAGVPFFFKQWGEWIPESETFSDPDRYGGFSVRNIGFLEGETVFCMGKKAAGRLLDGREWNDFPLVETAVARG